MLVLTSGSSFIHCENGYRLLHVLYREGSSAPSKVDVLEGPSKPMVAYESSAISGNAANRAGLRPDALHEAFNGLLNTQMVHESTWVVQVPKHGTQSIRGVLSLDGKAITVPPTNTAGTESTTSWYCTSSAPQEQ